MIQANELRVGNIVYLKESIVRLDKYDISDLLLNTENIELDYKPILLNEEKLLMCGFNSDGLLYEFRSAEYVFKSDFKYVWIYDVELKSSICVKCEHLHQLQNLIFTFTNQELEIKL